MSKFLNAMVFNAPDAGGGVPAAGASAAPAAVPPAVGAASSPPPSASDPAAGGGTPPAAQGQPGAQVPGQVPGQQAPAGDWYRPKDLPEHLLGKDQNETMDKLSEALKGYRQRDAHNGVPDNVDAYNAFPADVPDTIKPHLDTIIGDDLYRRVAADALALKCPVPVYQGLVKSFLSYSQEAGLMEPIVDEAAERAALVPDAAKHLPEAEQKAAVNRRMDENYAWLDAMAARGDKGGFSKDDVDFAKAMLGDSAKGHRFFEAMRAMAGGGQGAGPAMGLPPGGALSGDAKKADLQRRSGLPENTPGHRLFDAGSAAQLQADYQAFYGN